MTFEELKAKYPEIHHAPRENCEYCGGTGVRTTHLQKCEYFDDIVTLCICLFVDHEYFDEIQSALYVTVSQMRNEILKR